MREKVYRRVGIKQRSTSMITLLAVWTLLGCATLPTDFKRPVSYALTGTQDSTLGEYVAARQQARSDQSGFRLLSSGLDAFVARAVLADLAEHSIDTQYYLYHHDRVGRLFKRHVGESGRSRRPGAPAGGRHGPGRTG
jgi:cardiolipin synthase C